MPNLAEVELSLIDFNDIAMGDRPMAKCKLCGILVLNASYHKWKHWKCGCPHKMKFRYNYPSVPGEQVTITCLVCFTTLNSTKISTMAEHRDSCRHTPLSVAQPETVSMVYDDNGLCQRVQPQSIDQIAKAQLRQISNPPNAPQSKQTPTPTNKPGSAAKPKNVTFIPSALHYILRRVTLVPKNELLEFLECKLCKGFFAINMALRHRSQCKIPTANEAETNAEPTEPKEVEVLFSVQTEPTEGPDGSDDNASPSTPVAPLNDRQRKVCFVCGSSDVEYLVLMGSNLSIHSQTNIVEFIWKFMGNKPSVRVDATSAVGLEKQIICDKCLSLIDKYDAANAVTKQLEQQLVNSLACMEATVNQGDAAQPMDDQDQNDTARDIGVIDLCDDSDDL